MSASTESRYQAAANLVDGYVHESRFLRGDKPKNHCIEWANDTFPQVFGCTVEEYNRNGQWGGLYHPDELAAAELRAAALRRGETVEAEVRLLRPDGRIRWLHVLNRPVFDESTNKVTGVFGVGHDITKRKALFQESKKLEHELIELSHREQQQIANELRDGLGQELTGASLMLRSLADQVAAQSPAAKSAVEEVIGLVNSAIRGVCSLAHGLSPVDLKQGGLATALLALAANTRDIYGINAQFRSGLNEISCLDAGTANHLYRIAQEALANAVLHSEGTSVSIELTRNGGELELSVTDDGCGIPAGPPRSGARGLQIMEYRARMIGAVVTIDSSSRTGTRVRCVCKAPGFPRRPRLSR